MYSIVLFSVWSDDRLVRESRVKGFYIGICIHITQITPRENELVLTSFVTSLIRL